QQLGDLEHVEAGKLVVDDHDVEGPGREGQERLAGIPRLVGPMADQADRHTDEIPPVVVTVDDEHAHAPPQRSGGAGPGRSGKLWLTGSEVSLHGLVASRSGCPIPPTSDRFNRPLKSIRFVSGSPCQDPGMRRLASLVACLTLVGAAAGAG